MLSSCAGRGKFSSVRATVCFDFGDSGTARKILAIEVSAMSRTSPATMALGRPGIDFELATVGQTKAAAADHD
jgi:hypothetical protein